MACYGHFETDASFDEGAANGGDASVNCAPAEWGGNKLVHVLLYDIFIRYFGMISKEVHVH